MRTPPALLILGLLVGLAPLVGCDTTASGEATPTPPPASAFALDADFPPMQARVAAGAHYLNAAGRYAGVSAVVGANLIIPKSITDAAARAEPIVEDGTWIWSTDARVQGADVTFRLEGTPEGQEVDWRMRITSVDGGTGEIAEDFDLYTATTSLDGKTGSWELNYIVNGTATPVLTAEYEVRTEGDRELTFRIPQGRESGGSSVQYQVDGDTRVFDWLSQPGSVQTFVEWDSETRLGFIEADDYNGGARACWGADLSDTACASV